MALCKNEKQRGMEKMKRKTVFKHILACCLAVILMLTSVPLSAFVGLDLSKMSEMFATRVSAIDSRVENAVQKAIAIANDDSHGYDQGSSAPAGSGYGPHISRTGPDYDCSSFVYYAFSSAGFSLSPAWFSTRTMGSALINAGFTELTNINLSNSNALQRGDILWRSGHTEIYIGSNKLVGAHMDYSNPAKQGDTTGKEISVGNYYYRGNNDTVWTKVYRYMGGSDTTAPTISNVKVTDVSTNGYTITCNVTDNVGIARVSFPTWTKENDQDDIIWRDGTISGNTVTFRVNASEHNNELGWYATHIYAYDTSGNYSFEERLIYLENTKPIISNIKIINRNNTGYTFHVICQIMLALQE